MTSVSTKTRALDINEKAYNGGDLGPLYTSTQTENVDELVLLSDMIAKLQKD